MNTLNFSKLADVLYHVRCAISSQKSRSAGLLKTHLDYAQGSCLMCLESLGLRPGGESAEDADQLKLALMQVEMGKVPPLKMPRRDMSPVETCLDQASEVNGSIDLFRELGRFQEFCMRARFPGMVQEDGTLPVRPWIEAQGHQSLVDLREAAALYLEWTREVKEKFLRSRQEQSADAL